jgi:NADH dehydrogenase [ubiquinone] 1 alpha subcomplex assembly factor 1
MRRRSFAVLVVAVAVGLLGSGCGGESTGQDTIAPAPSAIAEPTTLGPTSTPAPTTTTAATAAAAESATTAKPREPVFDFPTAEDVRGWSVVNDTVMGGVSTGRLAWENGALVFTGELSLDNNGGFASVRSPLIDPTAAAGWADRAGLAVEAQGGGRVWTVEVRTDGEDGGWISTITTSADEIAAVELPWATFDPVTRFLDPREPAAPLDPSRIVSVAFYLVDGIESPFRLELRSIA